MPQLSDSPKPRQVGYCRPLLAALLAASAFAAVAAVGLAPRAPLASAQQPPTIGIDADPAGNTATSLAAIDACAARAPGETFEVDLFLQDVDQLLAWELYIEYDPQLLEVVARRVDVFQAADGHSNVYDVSDRVPDSDGVYRMAAADISDPPTPDSGAGVLAKLTLRAKAPGVSPLTIAFRDLNRDGTTDQGPLLRDVDGHIIGDINNDTFFDGPVEDAQIAIDAACPNAPGPSIGDNNATTSGVSIAVWVIVGTAAAIGALGLAALLFWRLARRHTSA